MLKGIQDVEWWDRCMPEERQLNHWNGEVFRRTIRAYKSKTRERV